MRKQVLMGTLALSLSAPCVALDTPDFSTFDHNIQHTNYNVQDVVKIVGYTGKVSQIVFGEGETVKEVYSGFDAGWELIKYENNLMIKARTTMATSMDAAGNEIQVPVQPTPKEWFTNLIVITDKRNYAFDLLLGQNWQSKRSTYRLSFNYPKEEKRRQEALEAARKEAEALAALRKKTINVQNSDYWMQVGKDSDNIKPIRAVDDGRFTYITFGPHSEIPAIFYLQGEQETLLNSHINPERPDTLVIQRIAKQLVLRLDDAVVGITNKGFGSSTVDNTSRSTIEGTERKVKGGAS